MGRTARELADEISRELRLEILVGRAFLQRLLLKVQEDLASTGRCELRGLGIFAVHTVPPRHTTHPTTGEPVTIKESKAIRFRASKELKRRVNEAAYT